MKFIVAVLILLNQSLILEKKILPHKLYSFDSYPLRVQSGNSGNLYMKQKVTESGIQIITSDVERICGLTASHFVPPD